ncbi:MAG: hypothetical protein J5929_01140 [Eubacterium sp.]|nr:hypothetical protein [Eubacterium sp.]
MILTKSLIKADIIATKQAIEYYETNRVKDIKNVAAYHLQQATEKLILYGESLGIKLNVPLFIRDRSILISDWEAGSRYDIGFSIRIDSLKKTYEVIDSWFDQV